MPGFEPGISSVYWKAALTAKPQRHVKCRQWVKIILKNKQGKHNYKPKNDLKMRQCPDLNQGSPLSTRQAL